MKSRFTVANRRDDCTVVPCSRSKRKFRFKIVMVLCSLDGEGSSEGNYTHGVNSLSKARLFDTYCPSSSATTDRTPSSSRSFHW